jgi:hypothetical protein
MAIRGWVYVISNAAMPDLLKIGFSLKDPTLRARELANTGSPFPYKVQYEALLENPRDVEQRTHQHLADRREGREWFRCTFDQAVSAIRAVAGSQILIEEQYGKHATALAAVEVPAQELKSKLSTANYRPVATYGGSCSHCGAYFTATLYPKDRILKCPECLKQTEVIGFKRQVFII